MRLIEDAVFQQPRIDRENGIIRGVKVLGTVSKNGRTYMKEALANAAKLYEQKAVNINHLREDSESNRSVEDGFGRLENIVVKDNGIYGDLAFLKSHPVAERVCEAAERMPEQFGLSHNANGTLDGNTVTSIDHVFCVDLVRYPATAESLFESKENLKEIDQLVPVIPPDGSDATSSRETVKAGFRAAVMEVLDSDMDVKEMKTRIGKILDAGANAMKTLNTEESVMADETKDKADDKANATTNTTTVASGLDKTVAVSTVSSELFERLNGTLDSLGKKVDELSRTVMVDRVLREQRIDRSKLSPDELKAIEDAKSYEDMVATAEKLPASLRESIAFNHRFTPAPRIEEGGFESIKAELELV